MNMKFRIIAVMTIGALLIGAVTFNLTSNNDTAFAQEEPSINIGLIKARELSANISRSARDTTALTDFYALQAEQADLKTLVQNVNNQRSQMREADAAMVEAERVIAAEEASRAATEAAPPSQSSGGSTTQTGSSGGLPSLLLTIRSNESGGNYQAYNSTGCEGYGCGGAYQMHVQYAAGWAAEAGYPGMSSNAAEWSPEIQDAVALYKFYATNPEGALWCSWASYC
jgi:hypothetical protein